MPVTCYTGIRPDERLVIHRSFSKWGTADKEVLYDGNLSLSAKAVYQIVINVFEDAGDHEFSPAVIARHTAEPIDYIESCLGELQLAGYLDSAA